MAGINKVILVGNLGKDPEVRYLEGGTALARFSLATSESYKDKTGKKVDQTEWHNIVVWRGLAEVAEKYLKKGMQIYLEGKIRSRSWDDKDGNKKYITEIVADTFTMLGRRDDNAAQQGGGNTEQQQPATGTEEANAPTLASGNAADDLPF